ncbi:cytoskeleton-associated protein 4 [Protopterus annectens]|uniref:cytoskeleton-associated protein 4 n=1 Tax=Protopterus annectens TaxID=7888 RepID=UPI001CF9760B|nr:cytoskeleton-associated protein 4 [Protopterus annectens]
MSSVKHRNKHASADRNSNLYDVAKKPPKGGSPQPGGGLIGPICTGIFYFLVIGAFGGTAWYLQTLSDQVQELSSRNQGLSLQNQELREGVGAVLQQMSSLKTTVGVFESSLKDTQREVDLANLSVKKSENEVNRIGEVLQKVQNEILRDLSDGIKDVKAAREKDFTSLENTVEERLTELTKSINDNIAVFTDVQKKSQHEISDIKSKVDSVEGVSLLKNEVKAIATQISDLRASSGTKDEAIASLKKAVDLLHVTAQDRGQEFTSFVQGYSDFRQSVESEYRDLAQLKENISKIQAAADFVSEEVSNLKDLLKAKSSTVECEHLLSQAREHLDIAEKSNENLDSKLKLINEKVESTGSVASVQSEKIESVILKQEEMETAITSLEKSIDAVKLLFPDEEKEFDFASFQSTLQSLKESQESVVHDLALLKSEWNKLKDVPTAHVIPELQDKMQALADSQTQQMNDLQAHFDERLEMLKRERESGSSMPVADFEKLPSIETSVGELRSSFAQAQSDLQTLRTTVDSLSAYSERIENNEKNLESTESKLEEVKEELNKMVEKLESIHEKF